MTLAQLLTVTEVARQLQLAERTLEQWRQARRGPPYILVGRSVRYRQADIDAWLAARLVEAAR
jgi:excisionase family DNA binding protein